MSEPNEKRPPNTRVLIILGVLLIASLVIGPWAGMYQQNHNTEITERNTKTLSNVQVAAAKALTVAESQRRTLIAVCARFNIDEDLSIKQAASLMNIEWQSMKAAASKSEWEYHQRRYEALSANEKIRNKRAAVNCPKAMQRRIDSAPTLAP